MPDLLIKTVPMYRLNGDYLEDAEFRRRITDVLEVLGGDLGVDGPDMDGFMEHIGYAWVHFEIAGKLLNDDELLARLQEEGCTEPEAQSLHDDLCGSEPETTFRLTRPARPHWELQVVEEAD